MVLFGVLSVFGHRIKGMIRLWPEQVWTCNVTRHHRPLICPSSCKDIARAPVTNLEPHYVTFAGYCYTVRHGMKVQLLTPYCVSHLSRYGITLRSKVTSVYPPLDSSYYHSYVKNHVSGTVVSNHS
jgi:hypothetical protein